MTLLVSPAESDWGQLANALGPSAGPRKEWNCAVGRYDQ